MTTTATEIVTLPLSATSQIEDPESPSYHVWRSCLDTIAAQHGCQRIYWGRRSEDPSIVDFFIDWDSVDHHKKFMMKPIYKPFTDDFASLLRGELSLSHAHFFPHSPSSALNHAPPRVTENFTSYFDCTLSESDESTWNKAFSEFCGDLKQHAEGFITGTGGWVMEVLEGNTVAFVAALQWESLEKHKAFSANKDLKNSIKSLQILRSLSKSSDIHHVTFQEK